MQRDISYGSLRFIYPHPSHNVRPSSGYRETFQVCLFRIWERCNPATLLAKICL